MHHRLSVACTGGRVIGALAAGVAAHWGGVQAAAGAHAVAALSGLAHTWWGVPDTTPQDRYGEEKPCVSELGFGGNINASA